MSTHVEFVSATHARPQLLDTAGLDEIDHGGNPEHGIVLDTGGDAVIIGGTLAELDALVEKLGSMLAAERDRLHPLPKLVPGDRESAECQHVWTEEDVAANLYSFTGSPVAGQMGRAELVADEATRNYRTAQRWRHGALVVDGGTYGDGEGDWEVSCPNGHAWQVPELDFE